MPKDETTLIRNTPLIPGVALHDVIGEGAHSIVYRGSGHGRKLAVKLQRVDPGAPATDAGLRFRREAAFLARVQHPSLPKIYEVDQIAGRAYLVMELVEGDTLAVKLQQGPLGESAILHIASSLAAALSAVHHLGLVHRDLKPQNIVLDEDDRARLIDFGLAVQTVRPQEGQELAGTFLYSAPEQTGLLKRPVDGRSDLYALGAVMFECATGAPPFSAANVGELIRLHAVAPVPDISDINPSISPALSLIISKLLAKDPDDRYQSADGLARDLASLPTLSAEIRSGRSPHLEARDQAESTTRDARLIGRERELSLLQESWGKVQKGHGACVLIEGEPGAGKSRLVQAFLRQVDSTSVLLLSGRCGKHGSTPLAPLREAIGAYLRDVVRLPGPQRVAAESQIRSAAGEFAPLLTQLSPALKEVLKVEAEGGAHEESYELFYEAIAEFLVRLAAPDSGVVLVLDDVQWADDASQRALSHLVDRLGDARVMLITLLEIEATASNVPDWIAPRRGSMRLVQLRLPAFGEEEVAKLVSAHLGADQVPPELVSQITTRSHGNPFAVGEYVRTMLDEGLLRPSWDTWVVDTRGIDRIDLPGDVILLVMRRLGDLPESDRAVLRIGALLGFPFSLELLADVCSVDVDEAHHAISTASDAHLLERDKAGRYTFVHDHVREALLADLEEERRRVLHQTIAEALQDSGGDDPELLFAIAKHYARGSVDLDPARARQANLAAGIAALESYANEEAFSFLQLASQIGIRAGLEASFELERALGAACATTGRLREAREHFSRAVELSSDRLQRAKLRAEIARVHLALHVTNDCWAELTLAFREIGLPPPRTSLLYLISTVFIYLISLLMMVTGIGYGSAKGKSRERITLLFSLYEIAGHAVYFDISKEILMAQIALRPLGTFLRLGTSRELASMFAQQAALFAMVGLPGISRHFLKRADETAALLSDRTSTAVCALYRSIVAHASGDVLEGERSAKRVRQHHAMWLNANDFINSEADLMYNYMLRGYFREALDCYERGLSKIEHMGKDAGEHPDTAIAAAADIVLGRTSVAAELLARARESLIDSPDWSFQWADFYGWCILYDLERGEVGENIDRYVAGHRALKVSPVTASYYLKGYYVFWGYAVLERTTAADKTEFQTGLDSLEEAIGVLRRAASTPVYRLHLHIIEAGLARLRDEPWRAMDRLDRAERMAHEHDCPWGLFEVARQRALLLAQDNNLAASQRCAQIAYTLAIEHGWALRARRVRADFLLGTGVGDMITTTSHDTDSDQDTSVPMVNLRRHLDALLEVSLASASTLNPDAQARNVLDEIVRLMGAERGFLFTCEEEGAELLLNGARDADGQEVDRRAPYSNTVVETVHMTHKPVVITGTDEGPLLASESAVAHGLRSIMAAPLMLRDRFIGVVYLDTRLAKGLFTEDDVEILLALGNHIAIATETARSARLELDRSVLEKDLALTAAVQTLFLPEEDGFHHAGLEVRGFYRSATHCGGDWWWFDAVDQENAVVLVGDVTGHGAASAMVTAAAATCYQVMRKMDLHRDLGLLMAELNEELTSICRGKYHMTMSAIALNNRTGRVDWYNAGAPPLLLARARGDLDVLTCTGTPLGSASFTLGHIEEQLAPGERLFMFTDGLLELDLPKGRQLGLRKLSKIFGDTRELTAKDATAEIIRKLDARRGDTPQADDLTFAVVDLTRSGEVQSS